MSTFGSPNRTSLDHSYSDHAKNHEIPRFTTSTPASKVKLFSDQTQELPCEQEVSNVQEVSDIQELSDIEELSDDESPCADKMDPDYIVSSDTDGEESSGESDSDSDSDNKPPQFQSHILKQRKFIVFEENLDLLLKFCYKCGSPIIEKKKSVVGSMLQYRITCHGGCSYVWASQPNLTPNLPAGNLILSAGILMTGNTYSKIRAFADATNIAMISNTTFQSHQNETLIPVIQEQWQKNREQVVEEMREQAEPLILAGDARCDTPGHNAKYGSYTLMSTTGNGVTGNRKIVSTQMIQVSEVKNANHMEPVGMQRCLSEVLDNDKLNVSVLATDRHLMIGSIMKKDHPEIDHQFDVWHVSKNITKKLAAKAKTKDSSELGPWIQSISNHLWWCSATCNGNAGVLKEKWLSLLHHITNIHSWTSNKHFHKCEHHLMSPQEVQKTKWLKKNSKAFKALQDVVLDTRLLKAMQNLTKFCHTGELEVYHTMLLKYCPKRLHFHYAAMKARLMLAALDWNTKTRETVKDEQGNIIHDVVFSKRRKVWVSRVRYHRTSHYLQPLMERVISVIQTGEVLPALQIPEQGIAPHVASSAKPEENTKVTRFIN